MLFFLGMLLVCIPALFARTVPIGFGHSSFCSEHTQGRFQREICVVIHLEDAMGASKGQKLSGLQKQVLSLYRGFLRAARSKPCEDRCQIESIVSAEFRRNSKQVDRKNFFYIEYLLRRGKKQLDQLKSPDTMGLSSLNVSSSQKQNAKT